MSVIPPKAAVMQTSSFGRFVPQAAVSNRSKTVALFDHLVSAGEQRWRKLLSL
jgi:hypothetical protein